MATFVVRYAPPNRGPTEIGADLGRLFERHRLVPVEVARLGPDEDREMSFQGGEVACESLREAFETAVPWGDFALRAFAEEPFAHLYFYWWQADADRPASPRLQRPGDRPWRFALEIDSTAVYFENGKWVLPFLVGLTPGVVSVACAAGPGYGPAVFDSVDPVQLVSEVRTGKVFERGFPQFHMLAADLISTKDIRSALETHQHGPRLTYNYATSGYHVLSEL